MNSGVGQFAIGQSAIGQAALGTPRFDWSKTIYAQYANSPVLLAVIEAISLWIDPAELIDGFYDQLWNITTARGYGLDVWGRIVGVNRVLPVSAKYFGFDEAGVLSADPFNQSPLYSGQALNSNYPLSDDAFRQLILAKAAANIWDGSIPGLNAILRLLFPGEQAYVTSGRDMTMQFVFHFQLSPVQQSIILTSGVLPFPAGVSVSYAQS
jgi:Protein of unknown function (DUF2612)